MNADGELVNSLVNLMNEVYRVLKPNGVFFASTPIFPHPSAFVDPTHMNIMTDKTYLYFIGNKALGQMYGFNGNFEAIKVLRENPSNFINPQETNLRKILRRFHRKYFRGGLSHHVWELKAVK
jgi:ubiquinone/menaquinone biosynthesis C-methylase UbiE